MTQYSDDLIRGWQAERAILEQKIEDLRTAAPGELTLNQTDLAITEHAEAVADIDSLITDFSRCEPFAIMLGGAKPRSEPIVRLRVWPARLPGFDTAIG